MGNPRERVGKVNVGGLFSGIGGIELGLERAGMRVAWHCEADPYARAVLDQHWPGVPCYPDVRELRGEDVEPVDVLAGGFPCQDISVVGAGAGIDGDRSGLWREYARLIGELRPRYVIVENVAALLGRGLERVLGDLAALGYDAEWDCIPAAAVGAPHLRDRLWLVAYPSGAGRRQDTRGASSDEGPDEGRASQDHHVANGDGQGHRAGSVADSYGVAPFGSPVAWRERGPWRVEPDVARMAHGVPRGLDRRRCLGNAVVPQIPELIGRRILEWEGSVSVNG